MNPSPIISDETRRLHRQHRQVPLRELARRMKISAPYLMDLELGNRQWSDTLRTRWDKAMSK